MKSGFLTLAAVLLVSSGWADAGGLASLTFGTAVHKTEPAGSSLEGEWIETPITFKNTSRASLWFFGMSPTFPLYRTATRSRKGTERVDFTKGMCGVALQSAGFMEVLPGASFTFTVSNRGAEAGSKLRVALDVYRSNDMEVTPETIYTRLAVLK